MIKNRYFVYKPSRKNDTECNFFVDTMFNKYGIDKTVSYRIYWDGKHPYMKFNEDYIYCSPCQGIIIDEHKCKTPFSYDDKDFKEIILNDEINAEISKLVSIKKRHNMSIDISPRYVNCNDEIIYRCTSESFDGLINSWCIYYGAVTPLYGDGNTPIKALMEWTRLAKERAVIEFRFRLGI